MSIYFDTKLALPDSSNYGFGKRIFIDIEWHKKFPLLAISHSEEKDGPVVSVYDHAVIISVYQSNYLILMEICKPSIALSLIEGGNN
jgi:hypothetical protein